MIQITQPGIPNIIHHQTTPAATWEITHNYPNAPALAIDTQVEVDGLMQTVIPSDVIFVDAHTIHVVWHLPHVGWARLG